MTSIMKNKLLFVAKIILPIVIWLGVWQLAAVLLDFSYLLPTVPQTFDSLWNILLSAKTYKILLLTLKRVLLSLIFAIIFGSAFAMASAKTEAVRILISPLISIMKSTPVTVVAVLFYLLLPGDSAPIVVALLMTVPVIWQNLMDGYNSIDKNLLEVCDVFEFSFKKRLKALILPSLLKYFLPALITSVGLAWKAVISAEILVHTVHSVGEMIYDAKYNLDTARVFAWTLIVITLSIFLEKLTKFLVGRCKSCK